MGRGVAVRALVAAADMTARQAQAKVDPRPPNAQAVLAAAGRWRDVSDLLEVFAGFHLRSLTGVDKCATSAPFRLQILVLWVTLEIGGNEWAFVAEGQTLGANVIERAGGKSCADSAALERRIDLGVQEDDSSANATVFDEPGGFIAQARDIALPVGLVDDDKPDVPAVPAGCHEVSISVRSPTGP